MFDTRGTEITVGSTIVYAVRGSTHVHMHEAIVDKITDSRILATRQHDKVKVRLEKTDTIVVVPTRTNVPEGALVVQVVIHDASNRIVREHTIRDTHSNFVAGSMDVILLKHTIPWVAEEAVNEYLSLPR